MRSRLVRLRLTQSILAAALLLHALPSAAACNPASCDAVFACGFRECIGATCETFPDDAGTLCRSAAGVCDLAESCNGTSLSCPTDRKRSDAIMCRSATGSCDAAENCTGTSAFCPADVGIVPSIDRVILLDRRNHFASGGNHSLSVELDGANLCSVAFQSTVAIPIPIEFGGGTPSDHLQFNLILNSSPLPNDTYIFAVNRGAAGGRLEFGAGVPDGSIVALSPAHAERVGPNPEFRILSDCSTCGLVRVTLSDDDPFLPFAETPDGLAPPPFDVEVALGLGDLIGAPAQLAEADYKLTIEAIAGTLGFDHAFAGDSSGIRFTYLAGTSETNVIGFTVPEPGANPCAWGAALVLAIRARARRRERAWSDRRRSPGDERCDLPPRGVRRVRADDRCIGSGLQRAGVAFARRGCGRCLRDRSVREARSSARRRYSCSHPNTRRRDRAADCAAVDPTSAGSSPRAAERAALADRRRDPHVGRRRGLRAQLRDPE